MRKLAAELRGMLRRRARVGAVAQVMGIRIVALAGNIASGLLTASFLGPAGRGEQAAMIVGPVLLSAICTLGLHASLIYHVRSEPEQASRHFGACLILTAAIGIAASLAGVLLMPYWLGHYSDQTVAFARLLLVIVPLGVMTPLLSGVLEAHGHFRVASSVLYFQSLGVLAILIALAALHSLDPYSAAAAYALPSIPSFLYLVVKSFRIVRPSFTLNRRISGPLLHYGLRFYGVDLLGAISSYFDQAVIVVLLPPAAVGAYAVALSLSRVLNVAQGAVSTVLFPTIAGAEAAGVVEIVARATRVTTLVNAAAGAGIGLLGPSLLLLLYGRRFDAAVTPFLILVGEAVISSAARTLAQAFSGTGRPSMVTAIEVAGVGTSVICMLLLIPLMGIPGAACGALCGGIVRLLCVLVSFRRVLGIELPRLVVGRADLAWIAGR